MRTSLTIASLLALSSLAVLPRAAHAQSTCSADSDCVKGWSCQVSGGSACAAPSCAPGEKCDEQPIDCAPQEFKSCQPAPCHADSDCATGLVCYTHTESDCPAIACAPGQTCPQPACEPKTESACVPPYMLPCTTASDCGAGFQCESAGEECACSGSAPSDNGGNARAGSPSTPEPSCTCEPSKEMRCHAAIVNCTADSDCTTAGWTCAVVGASGGCGKTPAEPTPGAGARGGAPSAPDCQVTEIKQCVPPYYALVDGVRGVDRDSAGSPTLGTGGSASEATSGGVIAPAADPSDKGTNNASDADDSTSSAGCSVTRGSGAASSTLALFGVLGLFSALRRRRAR